MSVGSDAREKEEIAVADKGAVLLGECRVDNSLRRSVGQGALPVAFLNLAMVVGEGISIVHALSSCMSRELRNGGRYVERRGPSLLDQCEQVLDPLPLVARLRYEISNRHIDRQINREANGARRQTVSPGQVSWIGEFEYDCDYKASYHSGDSAIR